MYPAKYSWTILQNAVIDQQHTEISRNRHLAFIPLFLNSVSCLSLLARHWVWRHQVSYYWFPI